MHISKESDPKGRHKDLKERERERETERERERQRERALKLSSDTAEEGIGSHYIWL